MSHRYSGAQLRHFLRGRTSKAISIMNYSARPSDIDGRRPQSRSTVGHDLDCRPRKYRLHKPIGMLLNCFYPTRRQGSRGTDREGAAFFVSLIMQASSDPITRHTCSISQFGRPLRSSPFACRKGCWRNCSVSYSHQTWWTLSVHKGTSKYPVKRRQLGS